MKYVISFNNGYRMKVEVKNGAKFIENLCKGTIENPTAQKQFYRDDGVLISINEITAVHPEYLSGERISSGK